jgi:hypothetical protein
MASSWPLARSKAWIDSHPTRPSGKPVGTLCPLPVLEKREHQAGHDLDADERRHGDAADRGAMTLARRRLVAPDHPAERDKAHRTHEEACDLEEQEPPRVAVPAKHGVWRGQQHEVQGEERERGAASNHSDNSRSGVRARQPINGLVRKCKGTVGRTSEQRTRGDIRSRGKQNVIVHRNYLVADAASRSTCHRKALIENASSSLNIGMPPLPTTRGKQGRFRNVVKAPS